MSTTGPVVKVDAATKSFSIQKDPPPALPVAFTDATNDEWVLIVAAWGSGKSVTVDGDPPAPTNVKAP